MSENGVFTFIWKKKKKEGEKECDYLQVIGSIYQMETRLKKKKLRTSRLNKKAPVIQEHGTHFQFWVSTTKAKF